jgi:hypothetical protein
MAVFIIIRFIITVFICQQFQAIVILLGFGNAPVIFDPLQVFDHHGHPVLAVQSVRTGANRIRQAVFIHDHPGGIAFRTVHPGNQAAIIRYGQIGNTSLPLIIFAPGDNFPAGPFFDIAPSQIGKPIQLCLLFGMGLDSWCSC